MKGAEGATGTGACAKALEDVTPHRGPDAGKETLGIQRGGLKTPTSVSAVKAHVGCIRDQGPWAGMRLPKHAGKKWRCGCSLGRTGGDGFKGKPPCGSCLHQYPAGLTAHGLRGSPYSVHLTAHKTIWGSLWLIQAAWGHIY